MSVFLKDLLVHIIKNTLNSASTEETWPIRLVLIWPKFVVDGTNLQKNLTNITVVLTGSSFSIFVMFVIVIL